MAPRRRVALLVGAVVVGAALVGGLPAISTPLDRPADAEPPLVAVDDGLAVWPYVSATRSYDRPASSINVVFHGDADRVRRLLTRVADGESQNESVPVNVTDPDRIGGALVPWKDAVGADRYTYVATAESRWLAQDYQLHRGDYLGVQHHLRVYELDDDHVAVQAHTEHWDWLLLTHVVDSLQTARLQLEEDLMDHPAVADVRRVHYRNGDTHDADGWATVFRLALLAGVGAVARRGHEYNTVENRARVGLAVSLFAVLLGVRGLGIAAERTLAVNVETLVPVFYPLVAGGVPLVASAFGRRLSPTGAFAVGAGAFALATRLDYAVLSLSVLPVELVVHRAVAAAGVGLLAAGAGGDTERERNALVVGAGLWVGVVVAAFV